MRPDRAARLHGAVDRVAGREVTFQARTASPNGRSTADVTRPDQAVVGPLVLRRKMPLAPARGVNEQGVRERMPNTSTFTCSAAGLAWLPRQNDRLLVNETGELFSVSDTAETEAGRIILFLSASA